MKNIMRYVLFMVAAAVLMSTCMVAFAKEKKDDLPTSANCTITIEGENLTVSGSYMATNSYAIKDKTVSFAVDRSGLVLTYPAQSNSVKTIRLGKRTNAFTVSGALDSLTLADTLDYHYYVTIDAAVNQLTTNGDVKLTLAEATEINTLTVANDKAIVTAQSGAIVQNTNQALDSETYLSAVVREYRTNIASASYDSTTGVLSLQADQSGCTVDDALKDVVLTVKKAKNDAAVAGQWYWPNLDGGATASGRYLYRFAPTQGAGTQELIVTFSKVEHAS
ncbi:hypothetical protein ACS3UN_00205 [Oscillospiraceae bacterium LTW-04]|nr:hypothetical protein RBH76_10230 [Oscillospiraceae bacterium MB24-C1]